MASFGDMSLLADAPAGGAVFDLLEAATRSGTQPLDAGDVEVEVREGVAAAVVRGIRASSADEALDASLDACQQGLDLLSARGVASVAVARIDTQHLVWWSDGGRTVLRLLGIALTSPEGRGTLVVHDPSGRAVPPPPTPRTWDPSMRYYRQAQVASDAFDAFRNLYLALESILERIAPIGQPSDGKPDEREGVWFRRALRQAGANVDLARFTTATSVDAAVDELFQELYEDVRLATFHSKRSIQPLLPHDRSDRVGVVVAIGRLVRLYVALLESVAGVQTVSGGLSLSMLAARTVGESHALDALHLSDDEAPFDPDRTIMDAAGTTHVGFEIKREPGLDDSWFTAYRGFAPVADLKGPPFVTRAFAARKGKIQLDQSFAARLYLAGFDDLEAIVGLRVVNARQPRTRYLT